MAATGTGTTMLVSDQLVGEPTAPLKLTKLVPCDAPKLEPVMVTGVPTGPDEGLRLVSVAGGGNTVMVPVPDFVGSNTEVAVRVTVGGLGTAGGAM